MEADRGSEPEGGRGRSQDWSRMVGYSIVFLNIESCFLNHNISADFFYIFKVLLLKHGSYHGFIFIFLLA